MVRRRFIHAGLAAAFLAPASQGVLINSTWTGRPVGNWNTAGNWSPAAVPNNGVDTYVVRIDNNTLQNTTVTMNLSPAVNSLIIDAGDTLTAPNNQDLRIDFDVTNNGTWLVNSTGTATDINLNAPEVPFNGSGDLEMSNNINNRIFGVNSPRRLLNGANHSIRGAGQVGLNLNFLYTNHGLVDASSPTGIALRIDAVESATNFNDGILQASGNGLLELLAHSLDNTGGVIQALDNGVVSLQGVSITAGEFDTAGAGQIQATTSVATLTDMTNQGHFVMPNNADVTLINSITNNGTWEMNSTAAGTDFQLGSPIVTLDGAGEIVMSSHINNRFFGLGSVRRLVHEAPHVIRGAGSMGINTNFVYTNHSLIDASEPAGLVIDALDTQTCFNDGILRASGSSALTLASHTLDNTDGMIQALDDGEVILQGVTILNGELATEDAGAIVATTSIATIENAVSHGLIRLPDNADLTWRGTITNHDTIEMNAGGSPTDMRLESDAVTFTGGGEVVMSASGNNRWFGIGVTRRLINDEDHSISGSGNIGLNISLQYTNHGLIDAPNPVALTIDAVGENFNDGVIRSSGSGQLVLFSHDLDNTGGVIQALDSSFVSLQGVVIENGELATSGTGRFEATTTVATLDNVTSQGLITMPNNADLSLFNTITNNGTWQMNSTGASTDIQIFTSTVTFAGDGELVMSNIASNRIFGNGPNRRLINGPNHTIRGAGALGININFGLTNQGSLISEGSSGLSIDVVETMDFTNQGLLHASTGNIGILIGPFENQGTVIIDAGRTLSRSGNYLQTAGTTTVNGSLAVSIGGSTTQLQGGVLKGNGQVSGGITNSGGSVEPGTSAGTLTVVNGYAQQINGTYSVEIGGFTAGTQHDRMNVTGTVTLGGTLEVALINGFVPQVGDSFVILTGTAVTGVFDCLEAPPLPSGVFRAIYSPTAVTLTVQLTPPPPADLNGDGVVGGVDLGILLNNWSLPATAPGCDGATCCPSDLNEDGFVNGIDLGIMLVNWTS